MATLIIGRSESSCAVCNKPANPTLARHEETTVSNYKNGRWTFLRVPACGEEWDAVRSGYIYPEGHWEEWCLKSEGAVARFPHLVGKPCYDALGKFVGSFGQNVDIQLDLGYDESSEGGSDASSST